MKIKTEKMIEIKYLVQNFLISNRIGYSDEELSTLCKMIYEKYDTITNKNQQEIMEFILRFVVYDDSNNNEDMQKYKILELKHAKTKDTVEKHIQNLFILQLHAHSVLCALDDAVSNKTTRIKNLFNKLNNIINDIDIETIELSIKYHNNEYKKIIEKNKMIKK